MYNSQSNNYEFNECMAHGACSVSPNVNALKAVMIAIIKQTSFYLTKLENPNKRIVHEILDIVANVDTANDYTDRQLLEIFAHQYRNFQQVKSQYLKENTNGIKIVDIVKFDGKTTLSDIKIKGQNLLKRSAKQLSSEAKYMNDIFFNILKGTAINYLLLQEYNPSKTEYNKSILSLIDSAIKINTNVTKLKSKIIELAELYNQIITNIFECIMSEYGKISAVNLKTSTNIGKAILVSGDSFLELAEILEVSKNEDISIYTNGNLALAHCFEKFSAYKNLVGNFGNSSESTMLDFATFPGAILLTKGEFHNMEYLYRGNLFSSDKMLPNGIKKAEKSYKNIIEAAVESRGFLKGQKRTEIKIGFDSEKLKDELDEIFNKLSNNEIKKILLVGFGCQTLDQKDYLKTIYSTLNDDVFVINFSNYKKKTNSININISNNYPIMHYIIGIIKEKIKQFGDKIYYLTMRCDAFVLSEILSLQSIGIKNIYLFNCPPLPLNPSVLNVFRKQFGINETTSPQKDIEIFN